MSYAAAGVDDRAALRALEAVSGRIRTTFRPEVVGDIGGFGGLFALDTSRYREPMLVAGADGPGTKVMVAQDLGRHDTIGIDLVATSANDVACLGAEPLFFLDHIVMEEFDEEIFKALVHGVAEGCREAGCALLGGETAQHPGHFHEGSYDLAGFCVGVVERDKVVDGATIRPGDVLIGIASSGVHANGFSLVRKVLFEQMGHRYDDRPSGLPGTLGDELLKPTVIYAALVKELTDEVSVRGLAHITGGGIPGNLSRILPSGVEAVIDSSSWDVHPIFELVQSLGNVSTEEMFSTFNMGIGMVAVFEGQEANRALDVIRSSGHRAYEIGIVNEAGTNDRGVSIQ